ncbi:MAG: hypothetical protein ABL993_04285 [Vicinamibacterales bacterium]
MKQWMCFLMIVFGAACNSAPADPATTTGEQVPGSGNTVATPASVDRTAAGPAYLEVTVPVGTTLRLELKSAVSSDGSKVEDVVRAEVREAVSVEGATVLPVGTELEGTITEVERSGRVKGRAHVAYRFNSINVSGDRYDVGTAPVSHMAEATKGEDATKIAIGAGAGAAIGAIVGGGDGAAKGAAIGGGAGTGAVLATRGREVRLGPGADVTTKLTAPLVVRVRVN